MGLEHSAAYNTTRGRIVELVTSENAGTPAPACPGWSVGDVVSHLSGLARDVLEGRLEGYATPEWTARQVEERRPLALDDVKGEWEHTIAHFAGLLMDPQAANLGAPLVTRYGPVTPAMLPAIVVTDAVVHEHDIRGALGRPGARDSEAVGIAMRSHVALLRFIGAARKLPDLELVASDTDQRWRVGRGEPAATLFAPAFELFRATGGRRSGGQIAAMGWAGDSQGWLDHLVMGVYSVPATDLVE